MDASSNWRKTIVISFPVYRYNPPHKIGPGTVVTKLMYLEDRPGNISRLDGLSQDSKHPNGSPPDKSYYLPGGVYDASGKHIPILDIDAPAKRRRSFLAMLLSILKFPFLFLLAFFGFGYNYEYRYSFGQPEQLDLEEFKSRLIKLMYQEKGMPRPVKKIKAATSFYEVMQVEFGKEDMEKYYKTIPVKNWLDEPKKYPSASVDV